MKKKTFSRKLGLNKRTIADLQKCKMTSIFGGYELTERHTCTTRECRTMECPVDPTVDSFEGEAACWETNNCKW